MGQTQEVRGGRRTVSGWAEMKQRICLKVSPSWLSNLLYNLVSKSIEQKEKLLILDCKVILFSPLKQGRKRKR